MLDNEELLFDELYEKTKDCGRTQFIKLLMEKARENQELKEINNRLYNENCKLREEHNITDISLLDENYGLQQKYLNAVVGYKTTMAEKEQLNSLVNSCQEEIRQLKKQLEEKEREFISYLEDGIKSSSTLDTTNKQTAMYIYSTALKRYKEIIGDIDDKK